MATNKKSKLVSGFIIGTFVSLYLMVSVISTIHVIDFFKLSNPTWLAVSLAIAFEVGAAASLASIVAMEKMNKSLVWMLFFLLTFMQAMGNTYYAYVNIENFSSWSELFGLMEEEVIYQKRILSVVSGAILPIVALGFIKSLVDYIKPEDIGDDSRIETDNEEEDDMDDQANYYYDLQDSSISDDNDISEPIIHDLGNAELITDKSATGARVAADYVPVEVSDESPDILTVSGQSDLPNYESSSKSGNKPLIHANEEIVNVNQNKGSLDQKDKPASKEVPISLDANPTRL